MRFQASCTLHFIGPVQSKKQSRFSTLCEVTWLHQHLCDFKFPFLSTSSSFVVVSHALKDVDLSGRVRYWKPNL